MRGIAVDNDCSKCGQTSRSFAGAEIQTAQVQDQAHQGQQNGEGIQLNKARYKKTVSTALWVQMALLVCYLPYGLVAGFISISGLLHLSLTSLGLLRYLCCYLIRL